MSRMKTPAELQASGGWDHLTKAEKLRRLARPLPPAGLTPNEAKTFELVCNKLETEGSLHPDDGPLIVTLIRASAAGDTDKAQQIINQFEARGPAEVTEPGDPPPDAVIVSKGYANDIINCVIPAGKFARLAGKRFLDDLANGAERGLAFDGGVAQHCVNYIHGLGLRLLPWQVFCLANIFGWKKSNGLRRFREIYIELAKKNGKSALASAIALYCADTIRGDGEARSNVFCAATTKFQSQSLCYKAAVQLRNATPDLAARTKIWKSKSSIAFQDTEDSFFEPVASNSEKLNGQNISCGLLDELADHPNALLYNVFVSSTAGRRQPLTISITTAGAVRENIAFEVRNRAAQALEGSSPTEAEAFFAFICELDDGDDWLDESLWIKSNPSIDVLVPRENIRTLLQSALAIPSSKRDFLRYNMNIWASTSVSGFINFDDLSAQGCAYITDEEKALSVPKRIEQALARHIRKPTGDLSKLTDAQLRELVKNERTARPFVGLDAALVSDLSTLCLLYPPAIDSAPFELYWMTWCPEENIVRRSKEQRVPYEIWREQKFIKAMPGETTSFDVLEHDILNLHQKYNFAELGFDRSLIPDLAQRLEKSGIKCTSITQGYALNNAIKMIERLVIEHRLCTFGEPVANWCFSNVSLNVGSIKGDVQLNKQKSREKIDLAAAAVFAMQVYLMQPQTAKADAQPDKYKIRYFQK